MARAFNMMKCNTKNQNRYFNSKLYASNRRLFSEAQSKSSTGAKNSQYGKSWMTNCIVDVSSKFEPGDIEEAIAQGWVKGRKSSKFVNLMIEISKNERVKESLQHLLGKNIKIHKDGIVIEVRELYFYREYSIDGWARIPKLNKGNKCSTFLKSVSSTENIVVDGDNVDSFLSSGLWELGMHNTNHRGTKGKTYKWVAGKKIFD